MSGDRAAVRERIVLATIERIEAGGIKELTVRDIAAAAGVNVAAINYYFGSKEALLAAALEASSAHARSDTEEYLARLEGDPEGALCELLLYYMEGALRYPRIYKAHLFRPFTEDDYTGPFPSWFSGVLGRLA